MADEPEACDCNRTTKLEELVHHYEQRNRELETYEAEVTNRLKILEETIPALKIWYMWRIFNAVGQPVQCDENLNKLLECESSSQPNNNNCDLRDLLLQLKDFQLKVSEDSSKLKDLEEAEKRLRRTITELEKNMKLKDECIIDEFAQLQSEKMEFLNKLVMDCKFVTLKVLDEEEKQKSKPRDDLIQMDSHRKLNAIKQDNLNSFVDSGLPEHLTRLEKEVIELQELIDQKDEEEKQIEFEKETLTYIRSVDKKTEKDEADSTMDKNLPDRLIQLEREVVDLEELLYQRVKEQKRMEAEEDKLCSHLQKCLDHLLSFKSNIEAPLLKNLQLQKENLNKLTKELELQKAEREQDNIIHYRELNELRKQIHKSAEDMKSVIGEGSKIEEDIQQIKPKDKWLPQLASSAQCDIKQKFSTNQAEHASNELKLESTVEEHETEPRGSLMLAGKSSVQSKFDIQFKSHSFSTHSYGDQSPYPEHPPPEEQTLSTDYKHSTYHRKSAEHMPSIEDVVVTEHVPSVEQIPSVEHVPSIEQVSSTEHVSSIKHVQPIEHVSPTEDLLSTGGEISVGDDVIVETVPSLEHVPSIEYAIPVEHQLLSATKKLAFLINAELMDEMSGGDETSNVYNDDINEDKSPSVHSKESKAFSGVDEEKPLLVVSRHELVDDIANVFSLKNKCRVKDHMIKSLADQLKGLYIGNHWSANKFYLNVSKDPVKTYDFDRTTLIEYIEGNEPSNMAASLMSAPGYSDDNPLQLEVLGKLDAGTVLISWGPPPANNVSNFQVFVNGELHCRVRSAARNKALLTDLYSMDKVVITLCALDINGELAGKSTLVYNINN